MLRVFIILIFLFFGTFLHAQGEIETERLPDNYNENTFGIVASSTGLGMDYRFSSRINHRQRFFIESEYNIINSPKEIKVVNPFPFFSTYSLRRFVFGKTYFVNNVKLGLGFNRMFFEKRDKNSISIHVFASAGGSLAISKPIYYEVVDSIVYLADNRVIPYTSSRKVDIHMQNNPTDIASRAPFHYGLNELKFHPGVYLKAGITFDYSREALKTNQIETGLKYDLYFVPFEIIASETYFDLFSFYISYRFGSKYNADINREARRWERKQNK